MDLLLGAWAHWWAHAPAAMCMAPCQARVSAADDMRLLPARYMGLLLAPVQLCADWSFACIPPVASLRDPRSLATAALYAWLAWVLVAARPEQARIEPG